jgi:DNA-binding phage protein
MTLDEIRSALKLRKISSVAKATGLTRQSLYGIMNGSTPTPRLDTYEKLVEYFNRRTEPPKPVRNV